MFGYNIKDFGAVGDGKADDTGPIQDAIHKAEDDAGGCVLVPPGKYSTENLKVKQYHVGLRGGGIKSRLISRSGDVILDLAGSSGCYATGMQLDGGEHGIRIKSKLAVFGYRLADLDIRNCSSHGLHVVKGEQVTTMFASTLERVSVHENGGDGIHLDGCGNSMALRDITARLVATDHYGITIDRSRVIVDNYCGVWRKPGWTGSWLKIGAEKQSEGHFGECMLIMRGGNCESWTGTGLMVRPISTVNIVGTQWNPDVKDSAAIDFNYYQDRKRKNILESCYFLNSDKWKYKKRIHTRNSTTNFVLVTKGCDGI